MESKQVQFLDDYFSQVLIFESQNAFFESLHLRFAIHVSHMINTIYQLNFE